MRSFALITVAITLGLAVIGETLAFQQLQSGWSNQQLSQLLPQQQPPQPLSGPADQFNSAGINAAQLQNPLLQNSERQPINPDLQNQIQALGAQLAAANRQIQFYQQQISTANNNGPAPPLHHQQLQQQLAFQQQQQQQSQAQQPESSPSQPVNQPINLQLQQQLQQQLLQQQQLQTALALQQQQHFQQPAFAQSQFGNFAPQQAQFPQRTEQQQPQQQPSSSEAPISTLVDNQRATDQLATDPRLAGQPTFFQQQQQQPQSVTPVQRQWLSTSLQQQQQQHQQQHSPTTSSSVEPASIEPSLAVQQSTNTNQPPSSHAAVPSVSNSPANDDKFSIGLGVLSPGYTQKFGNTALDFNQDKNGYSFTLSNNGHSNQVPPQPTQKPASAVESTQVLVSVRIDLTA